MNFLFALFSLFVSLVLGTVGGCAVTYGWDYVGAYQWFAVGGGILSGIYFFCKVFEYCRVFFKF